MIRFAELLDALLFTPSRNSKLRLMVEYFRATEDRSESTRLNSSHAIPSRMPSSA